MCQDTEISGLRMFQFCLEQEIFEFKSTLFYLKTKHFFSPKEVIYSFHHFNYKSDRTPTENQARPGSKEHLGELQGYKSQSNFSQI